MPGVSSEHWPQFWSDKRWRRRLVANLLAVAVFVVAVLGLYFVLPVGEKGSVNLAAGAALMVVAAGLLVLVYLLGLRRVARSRTPAVSAVSLLLMFLVVFVVLFAFAYRSLEAQQPGQIPGLQTPLDGLYFTVTVLTTVGFGDITPVGQAARALATVQMVVNLVFIGLVVQAAVKVGRDASRARIRALEASADGGQDGAA